MPVTDATGAPARAGPEKGLASRLNFESKGTMKQVMRIIFIFAVGLASCKPDPAPQPAPSTDPVPKRSVGSLTTPSATSLADLSSSLDAARTEFNAHKQEVRFLTLLAPT
jgi:hypothetical protein